MKTVVYSSPFVPPEWIAAHGCQPFRLLPCQPSQGMDRVREGLCPFAQGFVRQLAEGPPSQAAIFTSTCDQMRRAPETLPANPDQPVFLMNVPATWQRPASAGLYMQELARLGRFLERLGGSAPSSERLAQVMRDYEQARARLQAGQASMSARSFVEQLFALCQHPAEAVADFGQELPTDRPCSRTRPATPLALIGGPLMRESLPILDKIESAGGRVVLDATETGERSLPGLFDRQQLDQAPLQALAGAYFGAIADAFRRPDSLLYSWLADRLAPRGARGIIFVRQVWCDLWHAQLGRVREWSSLPVLDLDLGGGQSAWASLAIRVESFLEILR